MTNKNSDPLYLCACEIAACINQFENNKHYIPMKLNELNTADFPTLAYHVRRRVEQLIKEQDYATMSDELADVIEGDLLPALKALDFNSSP